MDPETEPLTYILNYYRDRIENNEEERLKWYDTLAKLRIPQEYDHRLRWELKKRSDELIELENAIKQTHFTLYDYRDTINKLKEENSNLVISQYENRKTIKDLLAFNNSVEQHVHFSEGSSPERLLSYAKTHLGKNIHQRDKENIKGKINGPNDAPRMNTDFKTPNILRTVYLENEDIVDLRRELDLIQKEINEEKSVFEQEVIKVRNEKSQIDEYAREELISDNDKISKLIEEFESIDQLSIDTFWDYGELIQESDAEIRKKEEENEKLRLENKKIAAEIKNVQIKCRKELEHAEKEYERQTKEYGDKFKEQWDIQSEYIEIIKEQYEKIQDIYKQKSKLLIDKISKAKNKMEKTEARRSLELGGYYEDLRLLNKKCTFYENYTSKLKLLVEQDAKKLLNRLKKEKAEKIQQQEADNEEEDQDEEPEQHYGDDNNLEPHPTEEN